MKLPFHEFSFVKATAPSFFLITQHFNIRNISEIDYFTFTFPRLPIVW